MLKELLKKLREFFTSEEQIQTENIQRLTEWLEDMEFVQEKIRDEGSDAFDKKEMADHGGPIEYNRPLDENGNKIWNEEPYIFLRWQLGNKKVNYEDMFFSNPWIINQLILHGILEVDKDKANRDKYIDYDKVGGGSKYRLTAYGKKFKVILLEELKQRILA